MIRPALGVVDVASPATRARVPAPGVQDVCPV